jgi:hypothetical protein
LTRQIYQHETKSGIVVYASIDEDAGLEPIGGGAGSKIPRPVTRACESFEEALEMIKGLTEAARRELDQLQPDTVQLEFGVQFSGKAGVVLGEIGTSAHCKVSLTWKK